MLAVVAMAAKAWGHVGGKVARIELAPIGNGHQLRADAAAAFLKMRAAAAAAGVALVVNSSFRTFEEQQELRLAFEAGHGNLAAEPGFSNHEGGTALDLESAGGTNAAFYWLTTNAARFSWRRTVASEPWHWEFRP